MRFAIITVLYPGMIGQFYSRNPVVLSHSFGDHEAAFDRETSLWAGGWKRALTKRGHEALVITTNNKQLMAHWARETGTPTRNSSTMIVDRLKLFRPDVVWFDYFDRSLLRRIRAEVPSVRLVLGWTGSSVVDSDILRETDIILSCAPETVSALSRLGMRAFHLDHAFDPGTLELLTPALVSKEGLTFVGQIIRGSDLHDLREELLLQLASAIPINIYSPAQQSGVADIIRFPLRWVAYNIAGHASRMPGVGPALRRSGTVRRIAESRQLPWFPFSFRLKKHLLPPVYGTAMLDVLRRSLVVLNVHANSSPRYASNMRMFETTGVGTCLLTEWRENVSDLFEPSTEVVTYRSPAECVEKARWLVDHPESCRTIGEAAQKRVFRSHTFDDRAENLESIIGEALKR